MLVQDIRTEIIAVWQRDQDGMQSCYTRDGKWLFRHGPEAKFLPGEKDDRIYKFDEVLKWANLHNFFRVQDTG